MYSTVFSGLARRAKNIINRRWVRKTLVGLILIGAVCAGLWLYVQFDTLSRAKNSLDLRNKHLEHIIKANQTSLDKTKADLKDQTARAAELEAQKTNLDKQIKTLKKENEQLKARSYARPSVSTTLYERIRASNQKEKALIVRALDLLKARDSGNYAMANSLVSDIYVMKECYAVQVKRAIYIGTCNMKWSDVMTATNIVHEATHVHNVYVKKIFSSNTKEQELPAYKAQLRTAQILNAPDWWVDSIKASIVYYSSLPR